MDVAAAEATEWRSASPGSPIARGEPPADPENGQPAQRDPEAHVEGEAGPPAKPTEAPSATIIYAIAGAPDEHADRRMRPRVRYQDIVDAFWGQDIVDTSGWGACPGRSVEP